MGYRNSSSIKYLGFQRRMACSMGEYLLHSKCTHKYLDEKVYMLSVCFDQGKKSQNAFTVGESSEAHLYIKRPHWLHSWNLWMPKCMPV